MPNISIYFDKEINISAQIGDIAYYTPTEDSSNFKVNSSSSTRIGKIKNISYDNATEEYELVIDAGELQGSTPNATTDFIFFSKDNTVNSSSVLGYYSEVKFENNSNEEKSELFSVGFEVTESSK